MSKLPAVMDKSQKAYRTSSPKASVHSSLFSHRHMMGIFQSRLVSNLLNRACPALPTETVADDTSPQETREDLDVDYLHKTLIDNGYMSTYDDKRSNTRVEIEPDEMSFVEVNGARLAYRMKAPGGKLIIALHMGRGRGMAYTSLANYVSVRVQTKRCCNVGDHSAN